MIKKLCILIQISLKFDPKGQIDNKSTLALVMAWHERGNMPYSYFRTHIKDRYNIVQYNIISYKEWYTQI